jgi:hypothetical protein
MPKEPDDSPLGRIEEEILRRLRQRQPDQTMCPSEVARALGGSRWRSLMQPVRDAAWRLQAAGVLVVLQQGSPVTREHARGPVRLGLAPGRRNGSTRRALP